MADPPSISESKHVINELIIVLLCWLLLCPSHDMY